MLLLGCQVLAGRPGLAGLRHLKVVPGAARFVSPLSSVVCSGLAYVVASGRGFGLFVLLFFLSRLLSADTLATAHRLVAALPNLGHGGPQPAKEGIFVEVRFAPAVPRSSRLGS